MAGSWGRSYGRSAPVTRSFCLLSVLLASACSSSAKLTLRDGSTVRGEILSSDETTVWILPDSERGNWFGPIEDVAAAELTRRDGTKVRGKVRGSSGAGLRLDGSTEVKRDDITTVKLTLRDGRMVTGKILSLGEEKIWLERQGSSSEVKRSEIVDVSHPGGGLMIAGGIMFSVAYVNFSGYLVASSSSSRSGEDGENKKRLEDALLIMAGAQALVGVVLVAYAHYAAASSRARYSRYENAPASRAPQRPRATTPAPPGPPTPPADPERDATPEEPPERSPWCELRRCTNHPSPR